MKAKKEFYKECHLAGRQYHDVDIVWNELSVGMVLKLERDAENSYDKNAIQVIYERESDNECFLLGYIPRGENRTMSILFDSGWKDIFECRISKITPDTHYEEQIHLAIRINRNTMFNITPKNNYKIVQP
ncbi:MAG: HIRAN domain-containing protein [Bacteroidales bacterium]|nr:HIRAN domain-containing protein [Bacteroidales bacterium]